MKVTNQAKKVIEAFKKLSIDEIEFAACELLAYPQIRMVFHEAHLDKTSADNDVSPKTLRDNPIAVKSLGQLIDELSIINIRIWMLIDKVMTGVATPEEAKSVQEYNAMRNKYVRAIDALLAQNTVPAKHYGP